MLSVKKQNNVWQMRKNEIRFNQEDREKFLIGMMQTNFLKRLESSAHSLSQTLERTVGKIDDMLDKIARYEQNPRRPGRTSRHPA